jgi:hypothetical protein
MTEATGGSGAPGSYRRAEQPPDSRLSAETVTFLSSLEQSVRPYQLAVRFPRIVNKLARVWPEPAQRDRYLDELLIDTRGRQGFPLRILSELVALKEPSRGRRGVRGRRLGDPERRRAETLTSGPPGELRPENRVNRFPRPALEPGYESSRQMKPSIQPLKQTPALRHAPGCARTADSVRPANRETPSM